MAISASLLTSGADESNLTTYTTASVSPAARTLVYVGVVTTPGAGAAVEPTITGLGATWTKLDTQVVDGNKRISVSATWAVSYTPGTISIDFGTDVQNRCIWGVVAIANVAGVDVATTVRQTVKATDTTPPLTVTLAAFGDVLNGAIAAFGGASSGLAPTSTPGTGWTELMDENSGNISPLNLSIQWRADNDTTCDCDFTGTITDSAGIASEIVALKGHGVLLGGQRNHAVHL